MKKLLLIGVSLLMISAAGPARPGYAAGLGGLGGIGGLGGLGGLPRLPGPVLPPVVNRTTGTLGQAVGAAVGQVRQIVDNVGRPSLPNAFEADAGGARVVRGEVLAVSPSAAGLAAAQRLNFQILRQENLGGLNIGITVLRPPAGMSVTDALTALRMADPAGTYDYNHIYDPSADVGVGVAAIAPAASGDIDAQSITIGMVDGGVDARHPDLRKVKIVTANLAGSGASPASEHGTAVASVIAGCDGEIRGAVPCAAIYAADVYGGVATGGSAEAVARGIAWVAAQDVPVINVSLVGPANALLETVTRAVLARGHVIVAAVGNDGPATPIEYPAGYDGVIAVTSVNAAHRIQIDANRGPQIAFAAIGVDVPAAVPGKTYKKFTGTSFAAPVVAAWFALKLTHPGTAAAAAVYRELQKQAIDLGDPGRDPVFGWGFLDRPGNTRLSASSN